MSVQKAIVIGAGVAGLASAIRLASRGFVVEVFERNSYPGGKLSAFAMDGYQFDAGPSLFTNPALLHELFEVAGEPIEQYLRYQKLPLACKYFYEDGIELNAYTDAQAFAAEVAQRLGEPAQHVQQYLTASSNLYERVGEIFLRHSLHKRATLRKINWRKALSAVKPKHLFQSMHQVNKASFRSPHLVQLFNRYATYNGSNPYKAPGMLTLIPHLEHNDGTFYPEGGMIAITNALYQLALKKGVQFYLGTGVDRIIRKDNKVLGVVAAGENRYADVVLSNVDAYFTYQHLLKEPTTAKKVLKQERSSSALIFYWGINREFPQLHLHNIFFSKDYAKEFAHIFQHGSLHDDPTVYINITSKCEPGVQAPAGKENWFVMVNVPANKGQDWTALKAKCRQAVIDKLSRLLQTDIADCIEVEETLDPVTIESKTGSYMGSLYGTSSNSRMAAFMRHPNFSKQIKGLYFAGGTVHPGGGIPLCLQSAAIATDMIVRDYKSKKH
jgi:phytoene desaturase